MTACQAPSPSSVKGFALRAHECSRRPAAAPVTAAPCLALLRRRSDRRGGPAITTTATAGGTEELLQRLAEGVETLTTSEQWLRHLDVQSRFHRYSFGNVLLIALQSPEATRVAGLRRWLELGRHVRRGQKGIAILAPVACASS